MVVAFRPLQHINNGNGQLKKCWWKTNLLKKNKNKNEKYKPKKLIIKNKHETYLSFSGISLIFFMSSS